MTDDIVARLRAWVPCYRSDTDIALDMTAAADEIERLRLEISIPRDEYAMTWKSLLDRIDGLDIVEWIRAYANAYSPSDYSSPIAREVVVRSDEKWMQAASEIERLRAALLELREAADAVSWTETLTVSAFERVRIAESVADEILGRKPGRVPMEDECGG